MILLEIQTTLYIVSNIVCRKGLGILAGDTFRNKKYWIKQIIPDDTARDTKHITPCVHVVSNIVCRKVSGILAGDTFRNKNIQNKLYHTILLETQEIRPCVYVVSIIVSRKVSRQVIHPYNHTCHCMLYTPRPVDSNHAYPTDRPTSSAPDISAP